MNLKLIPLTVYLLSQNKISFFLLFHLDINEMQPQQGFEVTLLNYQAGPQVDQANTSTPDSIDTLDFP